MSGTVSGAGQVLGASTAILGGVALLPVTGHSPVSYVLPVIAIGCGVLILVSLLVSKTIQKVR